MDDMTWQTLRIPRQRGKRAERPRAAGHSRGSVTRKSTILVGPRPTLLNYMVVIKERSE